MKQHGREFKVAAMGEIMMTRPISVYEEEDFLSVINLLREADVSITNMEGLPTCFKGQQGITGGTPISGESWIPKEYKRAGFNLVCIANNHSKDYGDEGLLAAIEAIKNAQLEYAGAGKDLFEARQPGYLETKKGRAAMVASSSFATGTRDDIKMATESGKGVLGRPGVNPLRYDTIYTVPPRLFEEFKKINNQLVPRIRELTPLHPKIDKEEISFLGCRVVKGEKPSYYYIPLKQDVEENLRSIRNAKSNAAFVIASNHSHVYDPALHSKWGNAPAEFIRNYAKECIDAGADIFYGHGDHAGQGIEIYKGRPIFYSLANPIVTSQNIKRLSLEEYERFGISPEKTIAEWMHVRDKNWGGQYADDRWVRAVVATFTMQDGMLIELKLHPIDSSDNEPRISPSIYRGVRPLMAKGEVARKIIERYAGLSEIFGTEINYKNGVGIVKI